VDRDVHTQNLYLSVMPDWLSSGSVAQIFSALGQDNVRFVGGCVRDAWLNKSSSDIDLATIHHPDKVMELLQRAGVRSIPTGIDHGTITAVCDGDVFEITTLRQDVSCDGRHADVVFTDDWKQDAARRDFTINALSMSLDGKIYDYFSGIEDLEKGKVRFVGDANQRIEEDYLRILRLFRFQAWYGISEISETQLTACQKHARKITKISRERIAIEMRKLCSAPNPSYALRKMYEYDVWFAVTTTPDEAVRSESFSLDMVDNVISSLIDHKKLLPKNLTDDWSIILLTFCILVGYKQDDINNLSRYWKLSNAERKRLSSVACLVEKFASIRPNELYQCYKLARCYGIDIFLDACVVAWSLEDVFVSNNTSQNSSVNYAKAISDIKAWDEPKFPLSGGVVQKYFSLGPSKKIGELLRSAEEYWEEEKYTPNQQELLEYLSNKY